jgi:hypothetical protein
MIECLGPGSGDSNAGVAKGQRMAVSLHSMMERRYQTRWKNLLLGVEPGTYEFM